MKTANLPIKLDLQLASGADNIPSKAQFLKWSRTALEGLRAKAALCIRIVDKEESAGLNQSYRHKSGPTNVLSFPFETPFEQDYLGDIIICAPIVQAEAEQQQIAQKAHWAHMTVHGILHLLGYDHIVEQDALVMESLEAKILTQLNFANPYGV